MKTVDFTNFKVTTNDIEKEFFEEGLIHKEMEMLSIIDARKHYDRRYDDDPFFETEPKDITYIMDLYQKLELFNIKKINFSRLHDSLESHSHGENQPVWVHWDGCITEFIGSNFDIPEDQETNPVVAVFKSFTIDENNIDHIGWEEHIRESIKTKMIEIEADHLQL